MLSHQLKQGKIDGEKTIIQNPTDAQKREHEKFDLETHEVYAMDVLVSTGEGVVSIIMVNEDIFGLLVSCLVIFTFFYFWWSLLPEI